MNFYKRIPLETIKNMRDLGGIPTLDGKMTSWGKIYRSANMDDINEHDIRVLKELNISTIIDLRRDREIEVFHKNIELVKKNFDYHKVSLANREMRDEEIRRVIEKKDTIGETYINLIDNFPAVKEILELIASSSGSVLFHCQEGKDRTGIITMLLYWILNVERSDIIADYEISSAYLGYVERYDEDEDFSVFRITSPYTMKEAISYVSRKYKTVEEYFDYGKIDKSIIKKIRKKMLD